MKNEKISDKNGKTDSEEDVKINKVNENGRWSVFFYLLSLLRSLFSILQKKLKFLQNY